MSNIYDVVVIGSGLGGLTAAARLAKHGKSVIVLEQYNRIGGFGQSYKMNGHTFDVAVHGIWYWEEVRKILDELDIKLDIVPVRRKDRIVFKNGYEFFATSIPEMKEQITALVPHEAEGIASYYDNLLAAMHALTTLSIDPCNFDARREFIKYKNYWGMTLEQVIKSKVKDPMAVSMLMGYHDSYLFNYSWFYPAYHLFTSKFLYDAWLPVGGSQPLVDALEKTILNNGGEIMVNSLVTKIEVEDGVAKGVVLDDGTKISAIDAVVSDADGLLTYEKMIGVENLTGDMKKELAKWKNKANSLSYFILNIGLDIDVKEEYGIEGDLTVYYPSTEILEMFKTIDAGTLPEDFWLWIVFPSVNDPTLAPKGHSTGLLSVLCPYNSENFSEVSNDYCFDGFKPNGDKGETYEQFKLELAKRLIERAEEIYPNLSSHIVVQDMITPMTIERITLNYKGATLGFMPDTSDRDLAVGFKLKSGIKNLYMAGAWAENGFSSPAVISSGNMVAGDILDIKTENLYIDPEHRLERLTKFVEQGE